MKVLRKASNRGHTKIDWLDSWHTFSFGNYYDPQHMGFGPLHVINDDVVSPGQGFDTHPHDNMEIVSIVISGALEHKDSMGHGSIITPGDVQKMSAGTGIHHSEFNPSQTDPVHFLQIWIVPHTQDLTPMYQQKNFTDADMRNLLCLVASNEPDKDTILLHADVQIYQSKLDEFKTVGFSVPKNKAAWIQVATGSIQIGEYLLNAGDGLAIWDEEETFQIMGKAKESNFILFESER